MNKKEKEAHFDYFLLNGELLSTKDFNPKDITRTTTVYEVIRIIDGIPLFLEEHLDRLNKSFGLLGYDHKVDGGLIQEQIHRMVEANKSYNYNLKIIINDLDKERVNIFIFFIQSNYPKTDQYKTGVPAILYWGERENPNIKVVLKDFRQKVNQAIESAGVHEAILVNKNNEITEGSRSNIFILKDNKVYTAPAGDVLRGVTRNRVIDLCRTLALPVVEDPIHVDFLKSADGLFMTGTSPKVLPIASVDGIDYNSTTNTSILKILNAYDKLIEDYIKKRSGS